MEDVDGQIKKREGKNKQSRPNTWNEGISDMDLISSIIRSFIFNLILIFYVREPLSPLTHTVCQQCYWRNRTPSFLLFTSAPCLPKHFCKVSSRISGRATLAKRPCGRSRWQDITKVGIMKLDQYLVNT
jgi:hypothetical protein